MIKGVEVKELVTHADERGFFREVIRKTDDFFAVGFGQLSHSLVHTGVIKAWHMHKFQTQWTYVASGSLKVVLHDLREESPTWGETTEFILGDHHPARAYSFAPGVAHGYRCINGPAHVIYVTSGVYDLEDEERRPFDDESIGYDWHSSVEIR